jgi:molybdopterin-guanine dinucleotide biosynthesis protein A
MDASCQGEIEMKVDAILPAGGRIHGRFAAKAGARIKALIPLGGRTVLERTLATLRATGCVERIVVIGPEEIAKHPSAGAADVVLPEGGNSGPANILRGLEWLHEANGGRHAERVLVITTDLPMLTPQAITGFLDACPPELDICLPLIRREEFEARFPGLRMPYVHLRDGHLIIGCAFLVNPLAVARNRATIERVFAARKNPIAMASILGLSFIVRFLIGRLTVSQIEQRCLEILGCTGKGIYKCSPELALDIDRPVDYRYAVRSIGRLDRGKLR